jgi:hypothetical protein
VRLKALEPENSPQRRREMQKHKATDAGQSGETQASNVFSIISNEIRD